MFRKEDEEMVKLLLSCPYVDVNARSNEEGATALIIACDLVMILTLFNNHLIIFRLLVVFSMLLVI